MRDRRFSTSSNLFIKEVMVQERRSEARDKIFLFVKVTFMGWELVESLEYVPFVITYFQDVEKEETDVMLKFLFSLKPGDNFSFEFDSINSFTFGDERKKVYQFSDWYILMETFKSADESFLEYDTFQDRIDWEWEKQFKYNEGGLK